MLIKLDPDKIQVQVCWSLAANQLTGMVPYGTVELIS